MTGKSKYYKHPAYGHVYGPDILTPTGNLSFPALNTPKPAPAPKQGEKQGAPRFESTILLQKRDPKTTAFAKVVKAEAKAMEGVFNQGKQTLVTVNPDMILLDGDDEDKFPSDTYPQYKDKWVLIARNAQKPVLFNRLKDENGRPIETDYNEFPAGVTVRAVVAPMFTTHGVSFKLKTLQFWEDDGTRYGGAPQDFASMLVDDDEDSEEGVYKSPKVLIAETETEVDSDEDEDDDLVETTAATRKALVAKAHKGKKAALRRL